MSVRKNQSKLSSQEWSQLIDAIDKTHGVAAPLHTAPSSPCTQTR